MDQDNNNFRLGRGLESLIPKKDGATAPGGIPVDSPKEVHEEVANASAPVQTDPVVPRESAAPATSPAAFVHDERPREKASSKSAEKAIDSVFHIEVDKIMPNPDQPRKAFDDAGIRDLASSIREFGLLQPIVVTKVEREVPTGTEVEYILISGERRLMASKMLGLERIPAIIRNVSLHQERLELAIIENIQREQLNAIETARAMARLQDEFRLTQREIAVRLGKSRETIANTVRLLDLPPHVQRAIEEGKISESHGRLLLTIEEPGLQQKLFEELMGKGLTTRELRQKVEAAKPLHKEPREPRELPPELKMFQERLSSDLGAPVQIRQEGESGKILINFYSEEELRNILRRLGGGEESY